MGKIFKFLACIIIALYSVSYTYAEEEQNQELYKEMKNDVIFGNKEAKITLIEYSSLSCPHCAKYYNTVYPEIKKEYIDTGKIKYIHRNFPLDAPSLKGAMLLECVDHSNLLPFITTLFKMQDSWAYKEDYIEQLENIAKLGGISGDKFHECIENKELEGTIVQTRLDAEKILEIRSTPSFILNGEVIKGGKDLEFFKEKLNKLLENDNSKQE